MQLYFYNGQPTHYFITTDGKCKNQKTNNWLKGQVSKNGYLTYSIKLSNNVAKRLYAHRMVAETYLPRIENRTEVNHIDGNKLNNNIKNLEWVASSENKRHAINSGLYNKLKTVYCFSENRELIATYKSVSGASRITGISKQQISVACTTYPKIISHGFYWSYDNDNTFEIMVVKSGKAKRIGKYSLDGKLIKVYDSMSAAARDNSCNRGHIGECCNGKLRTYKNYVWKYV